VVSLIAIAIVIIAIVRAIGTIIVASIVDIVKWAAITSLLGIRGNKRVRVPRLRVRHWRRRVVRVRGIRSRTIIPRVAELVLVPMLASVIRIRSRIVLETAMRRWLGCGRTRWIFKWLSGGLWSWSLREVCGRSLGLFGLLGLLELGRLSG
jgi:hypothetical protein